jgi:hypothetical protein
MTIDVFSNEQVIMYCFKSNDEIDLKILSFTKLLIELRRSVMNGSPYSEHSEYKIIKAIDLLTKCKEAKEVFIDELLNGKNLIEIIDTTNEENILNKI